MRYIEGWNVLWARSHRLASRGGAEFGDHAVELVKVGVKVIDLDSLSVRSGIMVMRQTHC